MNERSIRIDDVIWWNGMLVPWDSARVHVTSETALRGLNVFEGLRAYWRPLERAYAIVGFEAHLDRLARWGELLRIPMVGMHDRLRTSVHELLCAIPNPCDLYLRPTVYVDQGGYEIDPAAIRVGEFISWRREPSRLHRSLRCGISGWARIPPSCLPPQAKVGATYTAFRLARLEVAARGLDEAILLDMRGNITETAGGSVFVVNGDTVITPPLDAGILPSITRRVVLETLCRELAIETKAVPMTVDDILTADSAFIVGTLDEISNIESIDTHVFHREHASRGTVTELANLFHSLCNGSLLRESEWITLFNLEERRR